MLFEVKVGNKTQVVAASSTGAAKQAVYQQRLINSWISQGFNVQIENSLKCQCRQLDAVK